MTLLCLAFLAILLHTYAGYPISLALLRIILGDRSRHRMGDSGWTPSVAIVISAYNEEKVIGEKVRNCLELDYPADRIEIVVVSDGSTDRTEAIVRGFTDGRVRLSAFPGRQGKVACLNGVVPGLRTELVVMSDANSLYARDSLRRLVRHFFDARIGCVCGELRYVNPRGLPSAEGERLYWTYERLVKRLESGLGSLLGANGAIYAYRRENFRSVEPLMFCDDVIPIRITLQGLLSVYDPEAGCVEEGVAEAVEMRRRRRHASFGLRSMLQMAREAARKGRPLVLYQCISHRILRWLGLPALLGVLVSCLGLPGPWRDLALAAQACFYGAAALGFTASRLGIRVPLLYLPYYYLVITLAGTMGLGAFLLGTDRTYWEPRQ